MILSQSQWPCGLRCAAAQLLGLWVQSHLVHGCSSLVFVVCCVGSRLCDEMVTFLVESS